MIKAGREVFADLPAEVEIRNEAWVHLWYQDKFGVACPPYESAEAATDSCRRQATATAGFERVDWPRRSRRCPVLGDCRDRAVRYGENDGVRGALTAGERRRLRRGPSRRGA